MASYATLQADIALWLGRDDLTAQIPTFIRLAEDTIYRKLRLQNMIRICSATATEQVISNEYAVTVPADFLELQYIESGGVDLHQVSKAAMDVDLERAFTLVEDLILLSSDSTAVDIYYYGKPTAVESDPDSWFLANAYDLLLYGALYHAYCYEMDDARMQSTKDKMDRLIIDLMGADNKSRWSDNPLVQHG